MSKLGSSCALLKYQTKMIFLSEEDREEDARPVAVHTAARQHGGRCGGGHARRAWGEGNRTRKGGLRAAVRGGGGGVEEGAVANAAEGRGMRDCWEREMAKEGTGKKCVQCARGWGKWEGKGDEAKGEGAMGVMHGGKPPVTDKQKIKCTWKSPQHSLAVEFVGGIMRWDIRILSISEETVAPTFQR